MLTAANNVRSRVLPEAIAGYLKLERAPYRYDVVYRRLAPHKNRKVRPYNCCATTGKKINFANEPGRPLLGLRHC